MSNNILRRGVAVAGLAFAAQALAAPSVAPTPVLPTYGTPIALELQNTDWPPYLPATRYSVSGNRITIDYEYLPDNFSASRTDFGVRPVAVGELPAGNYTVQARLIDISNPQAAPQVVSSSFGVVPPDSWGIYSVPREPASFEAAWVMIRSAAYFDPASMRATVQGNVVRVDFDYAADAPVGGSNVPAGYSSFGAVKVAGMAPGGWRIEGWGRSTSTGTVEKFFEKDLVVGGPVDVVEFYAPSLDHYFVSAGPDEIAQLDANPQRGWLRTGERFRAWLRASDAPAGASPVCRFYASGPNSHFYTANASECQYLKDLEVQQRATATSKGLAFTQWQYEGIAFYALAPVNGACPSMTDPVYRAYNDRAAENDSNHRFTVDTQLRAAMGWTWTDEGVAFCSPR